MQKIVFRIHIEILNTLLDTILLKILKLKNTQFYKEYTKNKKPKIRELIAVNFSIYTQFLIVFLKKTVLYILTILPPSMGLRVLRLFIKVKQTIKKRILFSQTLH